MNEEYVILVDEEDNELGVMEKMNAHKKGVLHRAVSVFLFNSQKQLLLQQRASDKYHSGGLWTNTCCSHPRQYENIKGAAERRLQEEMGITAKLEHVTSIVYKAEMSNDMSENELDHIFVGVSDDTPIRNNSEATAYKYMHISEIEAWMKKEPERFTAWFKILFDPVKTELAWKKYL